MRRYDDPVDVRRGLVDGAEGPEQFLWRGRLWKVCAVVGHWVETGPWWQVTGPASPAQQEAAQQEAAQQGAVSAPPRELVAEREVWRVEAARGLAAAGSGRGVFDLAFDWTRGGWLLSRCVD